MAKLYHNCDISNGISSITKSGRPRPDLLGDDIGFSALDEKISALMTDELIRQENKSLKKARAKVPDVDPQEYDK